ncbi:TetR/AcrR family transcriptional regulator [Nesterenkonia lacusekhoensis]|uniref:AcrR family transcriptional regulator n=1 Tax=Nesterenkonia lacusekhoensis TaxID=150832 RepID=A0ABS4T2Z3_9MICC|nr:TetR/AcrR family transcriptional regulator [Nesterenkonia lacusekhoensis]MBP2318832.1 AcrR family transcriptional regulator [Nesterenkonia lacusekhoensis]
MPQNSFAAERTRRAILEAGIEVLSADPSAPLSEIATKAGVSRSTFHRYFSDREALRSSATDLAEQAWDEVADRARLEEGTGFEAYRRLCTELLDSLSVLVWWWAATSENAQQNVEEPDETEQRIGAMIARGHADGSMDPQLSMEWLSSSMWAMLYMVHHLPGESGGRINGFEARQQAIRSLLKAAAADPSAH